MNPRIISDPSVGLQYSVHRRSLVTVIDFLHRSSPVVDVPEVNSRIALRTIGKSINDQSGTGGGAGGGSGSGSAQAANNRSDQAEYQAESLELRPIQALEARKDESGSSESRAKKADIMTTLSEELEAKSRNVTVVVPVQHHSPSLGEDKTDQRCVSSLSIVSAKGLGGIL